MREIWNDPAIQRPRSARGCPGEEALRRVLSGDATASEREAFADHLIGCVDCAEEYRAGLSLAAWSDEAAEWIAPAAAGSRGETRRRVSRPSVWLALAASVAVAVGLAFVVQRRGAPGSSSTERGGLDVPRAVDPPDRANLTSPPSRLQWAPMEGASRYEVALYDAESTPIWKSGAVTGTRVDLPAPVRARLASGGRYLWRVVGRVGIDSRASTVFEFTLSR